MPVTMPALGASPSYMSHAASGDSSRNGEPGSISVSMRSRTGILPCSRCRATYFAPPPWRTWSRRPRYSVDERLHTVAIGAELRAAGVDVRVETFHHHPQQSVLNRQEGQRHTACMRYMSAPQRSHFIASSAGADGALLQRGDDRRNDDDVEQVCGEGSSTPAL